MREALVRTNAVLVWILGAKVSVNQLGRYLDVINEQLNVHSTATRVLAFVITTGAAFIGW
jgi:hypothetical protein